MSEQENVEPNNQQSVIEDLTVNEDQAAEVKGGDASTQHEYLLIAKNSPPKGGALW
jgi:hypothetical protein